jgi:hypothetical protein
MRPCSLQSTNITDELMLSANMSIVHHSYSKITLGNQQYRFDIFLTDRPTLYFNRIYQFVPYNLISETSAKQRPKLELDFDIGMRLVDECHQNSQEMPLQL